MGYNGIYILKGASANTFLGLYFQTNTDCSEVCGIFKKHVINLLRLN